MEDKAQERPNVLLVTAEEFRADQLCEAATPALDKLANSGVLCESMFSSSTSPQLSFAGLLGGQHPIALSTETGDTAVDLPFGVSLLPELFLNAGYTTCSFGNLRRERHWFGKGFEFYIDPGLRYGRNATARETNALAIPWLGTNSADRFFLNIHYRDASEVGELDAAIQELISTLSALRLTRKTLIVFSAACGEANGLRDRNLRVPLLFFWAGQLPAGLRVKEMLQTEDIAPTLLEMAGLPLPSGMDGRSFGSLLRGENSSGGREKIVSVDCSRAAHGAFRTAKMKLVLSGSNLQFYDLAVDPSEESDIAESHRVLASGFRSELEGWIAEKLKERARNQELFSDTF